jgi:hypothetical protein
MQDKAYLLLKSANLHQLALELEARSLVSQYFNYLERKDIDRLLLLFDDGAEIYEPISKHGVVSGKTAMEMFLKFMTGINATLKYEITSVIPPSSAEEGPRATADLWVKSYGIVLYRHTFTFNPFATVEPSGRNAIKRLDIELPK